MDASTPLVARAAAGAPDGIAPDDGPDPRLRTDEQVAAGLRRIAAEQLIDARYGLSKASAAPTRKLGDAIHDTRKQLKLVRALLRVSRDAIGEETYRRENALLRRAGQRLSAARDAQVLLETLEALRERFDHELGGDAAEILCGRLEDDRQKAEAALRADERDVEAVLVALEESAARAPQWPVQPDDFGALSPSLRRIYRRGRKARRAAREDPTPENLHEMRKRTKDLRHAAEIVCAARPGRLSKLAERAHEVGDLLGDNHDLHVLREYVESHPQCFADEDARRALLAIIDRRAALLCKRALKRSKRLYEESPRRFVAKVERGWRKRSGQARPLAE